MIIQPKWRSGFPNSNYSADEIKVWIEMNTQWPCKGIYGSFTLIARFMGPTWGPSGADRTQVGPMLTLWTLLSGQTLVSICWGNGLLPMSSHYYNQYCFIMINGRWKYVLWKYHHEKPSKYNIMVMAFKLVLLSLASRAIDFVYLNMTVSSISTLPNGSNSTHHFLLRAPLHHVFLFSLWCSSGDFRSIVCWPGSTRICSPNNKVHGAYMGPIWGWQDPGGPLVGPMNFAIWGV